MNKVELLAPAGDLKRLKTAVNFGADAVYLGGKSYSLRARASNFQRQDIIDAVNYAHAHHKKVFVTINMIFHEEDLEGLRAYLIDLDEIGVDAIIVASYYVVKLALEVTQSMEIHLSTQLSATNAHALTFYKKLGADRVVLARECSLVDVQQINAKQILPTEVFIHGGMCANISGRCTLSNYMTYRDANRGGCAQSCRWKYEVYDQDQQKFKETATLFSMSSKDLNATPILKELLEAKVASLKIEGRMKSEYYLATVVSAYRMLIDKMNSMNHADLVEQVNHELSKAEGRETFTGFYERVPDAGGHLYEANGAGVMQVFLGVVLGFDAQTSMATMQVRNHFDVGTTIEIFGPKHENFTADVTTIIDSEGEIVQRVYKPMEIIQIKLPFSVDAGDFIRKVNA